MLTDLSFFESAEFWKAVAFILSVVAVMYPSYLYIVKKVRERNKEIIAHFESALELERQAKDALDTAKEKLEKAETDKQQIMDAAKTSAKSLQEESDAKLQSIVLHREKENEERVSLIRENGLKQLQDKFLEIAVDMTQTLLTDEQIMSKNTLTESSLKELQSILQDKKNVQLLKNRLLEEG